MSSASSRRRTRSANPESAAVDYDAALAGRPRRSPQLYAKGDAIIPGGADAFEPRARRSSAATRWSSTTGPPGAGRAASSSRSSSSRPAEQGKRIAFLGVDTEDADGRRQRPSSTSFPLPYPSVSDPDKDVDKLIKGYDNSRRPRSTTPAATSSTPSRAPTAPRQELEADIERYAADR